MADPILRLDPERVSVEPGGEATLTLTVTNPGTIVEGYSVDVVSTVPMPWAEVNPSTLSVYPQQEATTVIVFRPPAGPGAAGGSVPFGVRVWSEVADGGRAVAEGDLEIGSVAGLQAKMTPLASTGRWSGRHVLKVSNWGNAPARLRITPEDPDQALGFLVSPEVLDIPLGAEATARIKVRTRAPTLRGAARRLPFQVACEPDPDPDLGDAGGRTPGMSTAGRPVVDGAFNQKPILTRMVVVVAGLLLLALIAGIGYVLTREVDPDAVEEPRQPAPPTGFAAAPSEGIVTFTWDKVAGVQDYQLLMTAPSTDESPIVSVPLAGDPTKLESKIEVETAARYCYRLVALRDGAPDSLPSEEQCVDTVLPAGAPPGPTDSPSIVPVTPPPDGGDESSSPTVSGSVSPDPLPNISVLRFYPVEGAVADPAAANAARDALISQGFTDVKVLDSEDWTLNPPLDASQRSHVLYVDGQTAVEAETKCTAILEQAPTSVETGCIVNRTVAPKDGATP